MGLEATSIVARTNSSARRWRRADWLPYAAMTVVYGHLIGAFVVWLREGQDVSDRHLAFLFLGGLGLWTLAEYVIHRWVQHVVFPWKWLNRWSDHLWHHRHPDDADIVFHLSGSLPVFAGLSLFAFLLTWNLASAAALLCGMMAGYVWYETAHVAAHYREHLPLFVQPLIRNHCRHHDLDQGAYFGTTTPLWDWIFGTHRPLRRLAFQRARWPRWTRWPRSPRSPRNPKSRKTGQIS